MFTRPQAGLFGVDAANHANARGDKPSLILQGWQDELTMTRVKRD